MNAFVNRFLQGGIMGPGGVGGSMIAAPLMGKPDTIDAMAQGATQLAKQPMNKTVDQIFGPALAPRLEKAANLPDWASTAINEAITLGAEFI